MPGNYIIVDGDELVLVSVYPPAVDRLTREMIHKVLRPVQALGFPLPDLDGLKMAEIAIRLSGAFAGKADLATELLAKIDEITTFSINKGGAPTTLSAALSVREEISTLIIRRGREDEDGRKA
jgi:hypothetical protein